VAVKWKSAFVGGFRIARAEMETGDSLEFQVPVEIARAEQRNYSLFVEGQWASVRGDGSTNKWGPGLYSVRDIPQNHVPPKIVLSCAEGPGLYYCIEPTDRTDKWERTAFADLADEFIAERGHVVFVASGEVTVSGEPFTGPAIINVSKRTSVAVRKKTADPMGVLMRIIEA